MVKLVYRLKKKYPNYREIVIEYVATKEIELIL